MFTPIGETRVKISIFYPRSEYKGKFTFVRQTRAKNRIFYSRMNFLSIFCKNVDFRSGDELYF